MSQTEKVVALLRDNPLMSPPRLADELGRHLGREISRQHIYPVVRRAGMRIFTREEVDGVLAHVPKRTLATAIRKWEAEQRGKEE